MADPLPSVRRAVTALRSALPEQDDALSQVVDLAVLVACADGSVDLPENRAVRESIVTVMGSWLKAEVLQHLINESVHRVMLSSWEARARAAGEVFARANVAQPALELAAALAWASNGLCPEERAVILTVARAAGVTDAEAQRVIDAVYAEVKDSR